MAFSNRDKYGKYADEERASGRNPNADPNRGEFDLVAICQAFDDFLNAVYLTSDEFFDSYDIIGYAGVEDMARFLHKELRSPLPKVPEPIEGKSEEYYAQMVYDAAEEFHRSLEDNAQDRALRSEYQIQSWVEYAEEIKDMMQEILE